MMEKIKKIREATGAGVVDVKKALDEAGGSEEKALKILKQKGLEKADKKKDRQTREGIIGSYLHTDGKQASLIKVYCETDFVAKNEEFQALAKDLAMQVAAMNPQAVKPEDVSNEIIEEKKEYWKKELESEEKPEEVKKKILQGREDKARKESALLSQSFVKDQNKTVEEHVKEKIAMLGENIEIGEFTKMEI
ncbi:MAG: elongation factor Ts [Candidatus Moranbacteria bacterium]|nr:elongation factor Ts [Candidatus Moranbacteria bacterium]